jgi:hypothetical protein
VADGEPSRDQIWTQWSSGWMQREAAQVRVPW